MRNTMKQVRPEDFDAQAMYDAAREGRLYVVVYEDEMAVELIKVMGYDPNALATALARIEDALKQERSV